MLKRMAVGGLYQPYVRPNICINFAKLCIAVLVQDMSLLLTWQGALCG